MAGSPWAMEDKQEDPDEPEEEEEDDSDNREDSAGLDDKDGGFVSERRLGPYATHSLAFNLSIRAVGVLVCRRRQGH